MLGAAGFLLWRGERLFVNAGRVELASSSEVFKEELFRLEIDRLHGAISGDEYDSARQALEGTIKRALTRAGTKT